LIWLLRLGLILRLRLVLSLPLGLPLILIRLLRPGAARHT
jgi:hypothetical protein